MVKKNAHLNPQTNIILSGKTLEITFPLKSEMRECPQTPLLFNTISVSSVQSLSRV